MNTPLRWNAGRFRLAGLDVELDDAVLAELFGDVGQKLLVAVAPTGVTGSLVE